MEDFQVFAGWLIDGTGGPILHNALLEVSMGRITSVRTIESGSPLISEKPALQFSCCTILPGMVDVHVHLAFSGSIDPVLRKQQLQFSIPEQQPLIHEHLRKHMSHGIVAVRDGGDRNSSALYFKNNDLTGSHLPIRVHAAGTAWHARDRYGSLIGLSPRDGESLARSIRFRTPKGADHVKIINSGLNSLKVFGKETTPQFPRDDLRAALIAARELGMGSMIHANGKSPVQDAIAAGCQSIEHGFFMGTENLKLLAEQQIYWAPTAFSMRAYANLLEQGSTEARVAAANLNHQIHQLSLARKLGVPVVVGTDSGGYGLDHGAAFAGEFGILLESGYSIEEAVRCATWNGAQLLGLDNELGLIRAGMPATFVILDGPPESLPQTLSQPCRVYMQGNLISNP